MTIAVLGAGAFGTALAVALAQVRPVTLWARDASMLRQQRQSPRLPGIALPDRVTVETKLSVALDNDVLLFAVPAQSLAGFLNGMDNRLVNKTLVACCKGIDLTTGHGPSHLLHSRFPDATAAVLTGPSFAADIAAGLPTALTLACRDDILGQALQRRLSTPTLRLYRTTDVTGAELGGALKNVVAIACGVAIGAGFGDSARAALMTRGLAEIRRVAQRLGAQADTLMGLSGFGDLVLTCTSEKSRNFRYGLALGRGDPFDENATVEGVKTARAMVARARELAVDVPICDMTNALVSQHISPTEAMAALLNRPLKEE